MASTSVPALGFLFFCAASKAANRCFFRSSSSALVPSVRPEPWNEEDPPPLDCARGSVNAFARLSARAFRARRVRDAWRSRGRATCRGERSRATSRDTMSAFSDPTSTKGGTTGRSSSSLARGVAVRPDLTAPYLERVVLLRHRLHVVHHLLAHLVSVRRRLGRARTRVKTRDAFSCFERARSRKRDVVVSSRENVDRDPRASSDGEAPAV